MIRFLHLHKAEATRLTSMHSKIAVHIAEAAPKEKVLIVDAFAGVGGNAIAFARNDHFAQVIAIEKDPKTMKCARHNAKIYGVDKKILWCTGDCFDVIKKRLDGNTNVIIFASPPWGGKLCAFFLLRSLCLQEQARNIVAKTSSTFQKWNLTT